jgi:hypothetical protein
VGITVTTRGPSFDRLIADTTRDLRGANRAAGRRIATVGKAAIRQGAPRMWGKKLGVKTTVDAGPDSARVEFVAKPAGGWAIRESGTRPHPIRPRNAKALHWFFDRYTMLVSHPGSGGERAWTRAGERLKRAVDPVIEHIYDEAMV